MKRLFLACLLMASLGYASIPQSIEIRLNSHTSVMLQISRAYEVIMGSEGDLPTLSITSEDSSAFMFFGFKVESLSDELFFSKLDHQLGIMGDEVLKDQEITIIREDGNDTRLAYYYATDYNALNVIRQGDYPYGLFGSLLTTDNVALSFVILSMNSDRKEMHELLDVIRNITVIHRP